LNVSVCPDARRRAVFAVTARDLENRLPPPTEQSRTVKLRGLPYEITQEAVREFFLGQFVRSISRAICGVNESGLDFELIWLMLAALVHTVQCQ